MLLAYDTCSVLSLRLVHAATELGDTSLNQTM